MIYRRFPVCLWVHYDPQRTAKVETQELTNVLPVKSEVGQNIASHAFASARNSVVLMSTFLAYSTAFFSRVSLLV